MLAQRRGLALVGNRSFASAGLCYQTWGKGWHPSEERFPAKGDEKKQQALSSAWCSPAVVSQSPLPRPHFGFRNILNTPLAVPRPPSCLTWRKSKNGIWQSMHRLSVS